MDQDFADQIVKKCISHYHSLGKKGKPVLGKEWTLLSSVVMSLNSKTTVVAMATGTKCLGQNKLSPRGDLVNDSHAEVLARRCFLRYLYDQILKFQETGQSDIIIGYNEKNQYEINPDVKFHFYSSHVPCGDASIIPKIREKRKCENSSNQKIKRKSTLQIDMKDKIKNDNKINIEHTKENNEKGFMHDNLNSDKLKLEGIDCSVVTNANEEILMNSVVNPNKTLLNSFKLPQNKSEAEECRSLFEKESISRDLPHISSCDMIVDDLEDSVGDLIDIHRTGAKCLLGEDKKLPGVLYHQVGAVRTKPGRGDPTVSVSCSDKMARWIECGLQGALLSLLLNRPVMLTSVVIGGGGQFSAEALKRALLSRSTSPHSTALLHSSITFPHSRYLVGSITQPCPSAIIWAPVTYKPLEVCVEGRRQGATKNCNSGRLMICKLELLRTFLSVSNNNEYCKMSYKTLKALAEPYSTAWIQLKNALKVWTVKPPYLEDFKIDS